MQAVERRPSLLFDEYQNSVTKPNETKNKEARVLSENDGDVSPSVLKQKEISVDDMDMISLPTEFDRQMVLGSPMFFDLEDEETKLIHFLQFPIIMEMEKVTALSHRTRPQI